MSDTEQEEMSFLEHLEVLRWHIVRSFIALGIGASAAFVFKSFVFDVVILAPMRSDFITYRALCKLSHLIIGGDQLCFEEITFNLINIAMSGQFTTHIVVSLVAGFVVAFPYILFEIWSFVRPGLHKTERKYTTGIVFSGSVLFITGVLFGYFLIAPLSVQFLGNYTVSSAVTNTINLNSFITTLTTITLACGLVFQLPLMVYFLTKMGIVTPGFLKKYRKHSLVVALLLAAIITPPDISSQILVTLPLAFLYEISIYISRIVVKREDK